MDSKHTPTSSSRKSEKVIRAETEWLKSMEPSSAIPACGELSPESGKPCRLDESHDGAHEAVIGPYSLAAWA